MTTEIVVMNKSAISLAADSAVTIGKGSKFYNTANKLFMLSKYHPIGIMVYSNSEFMGYPVETIIKEYRKKIGERFFDTLEEYWDDFLEYLNHGFAYNNEIEDLSNQIALLIHNIDDNINMYTNHQVDEHMGNGEGLNETLEQNQTRIKEFAKASIPYVIDIIHNDFSSYTDDEKFYDQTELIKDKIQDRVYDYVDEIIGKVESKDLEKILDICVMFLSKEHNQGSRTGIVITGFGEKDMFPKIISAEFMGSYFGELKYDDKYIAEIGHDRDATIKAYAQADVISTFMTGIDEDLYIDIMQTIDKYKSHKCDDYKCIEELKEEVGERIQNWSRSHHVDPILGTVTVAPKEELAQMAETLVSLTSFRRNLSIDAYSQSVGGPIDVALITKGDGFVWIKRKHYFDMNKNHHFKENYFKHYGRDRFDFSYGEEK